MTPEWKESQRPAFEAWWSASGRDTAWCSQREDGSFNIRMVEIAFDAWLAAKADQAEVTDEMVDRAVPHMYGAEAGDMPSDTADLCRSRARKVLSAALNPSSPQGTEGEK